MRKTDAPSSPNKGQDKPRRGLRGALGHARTFLSGLAERLVDQLVERSEAWDRLLKRARLGAEEAVAGRRNSSWPRDILDLLTYLRDRGEHPASRAQALFVLRRRLRQAKHSLPTSSEIDALLDEIVHLKRDLVAAFASVQVCRSCGYGYPPPHGAWPGGACCGAETEYLFSSDELAVIASSSPSSQLMPATGVDGGCAFRGEFGCVLAPELRPALCIYYACEDLELELETHPEGATIQSLRKQLRDKQAKLAALRNSYLQDTHDRELWRALSKAKVDS